MSNKQAVRLLCKLADALQSAEDCGDDKMMGVVPDELLPEVMEFRGRLVLEKKYIFFLDRENEEDEMFFAIAEETYWEEHHCLDDCSLDVELPEGFAEAMDSTYDYRGPWEKGRQKLLKAGFEEIENPF